MATRSKAHIAYDKKMGLKEGTPKDNKVDKKMGVPIVVVAVGKKAPKKK